MIQQEMAHPTKNPGVYNIHSDLKIGAQADLFVWGLFIVRPSASERAVPAFYAYTNSIHYSSWV